jgi:hypothetical protein
MKTEPTKARTIAYHELGDPAFPLEGYGALDRRTRTDDTMEYRAAISFYELAARIRTLSRHSL